MQIKTLIAALVFVAGCGDAGFDTDAGDFPTFTEIREDILLPSCSFSACHGNDTGGLMLSVDDPGAIYDALVDAPSVGAPEETLVIPGDSANSYLIKKLEGAPGIDGDPMPAPFGLDSALIADIASWIDGGALDD